VIVSDALEAKNRFRPHEKLRSSEEYLRVKKKGRRVGTPHFGVNFMTSGLHYHRLGLVVQKRFWNSVRRNRIKRCLREWFRHHKHSIPLPGKDIVVIARPGAEMLTSTGIASELVPVFAKKQDARIS
jgi:ribonuclease P protein component